jgi:hypothetical protein
MMLTHPTPRFSALAANHKFCTAQTELYRSISGLAVRPITTGSVRALSHVIQIPTGASVRLRFWLLGLPAGIGLATGRGIFKLWCVYHPEQAGVFSAGNGPAIFSVVQILDDAVN